MLGYEERGRILKKMGYGTYQSYLESELWVSIRQRVLERDKNKCRLCDKPANIVHHAGYTLEQLQGKADHLLFSLCHGCHKRLEFDLTEPKRKLCVSSVVAKTLTWLKAKGKKRKRSKPWLGLRHKRKYQQRHRQ